MLIRALASGGVLLAMLLVWVGSAHADGGVVQGASKAAAKGVVKGVQQQLNPGEIVNRAKDVTKGVADGIADAVPMITSQFLNQANVNRKSIGRVVRQASTEAVAGALDVTARELEQALGAHAMGPLADAIAALTERTSAAASRGVVSEIHLDPAVMEKLTAAAVRGAVSELHFHFRIWPLVFAFILGGTATLFCGLGLLLLYLLFERKRPSAVATTIQTQPMPSGSPQHA